MNIRLNIQKKNWYSSEAVTQRCSVKTVFLEISQNSQKNTCARASFLIKLQAEAEACNFIKKEALEQVFSCEFCEISKNTFFDRTPLVVASNSIKSIHIYIALFLLTSSHISCLVSKVNS